MEGILWLLLAFLASFCTFCGQSDRISCWISNNIYKSDVSLVKDTFTFLSIIVSTYLGVIIVKKEYYLKKINRQNRFLMTNAKNEILDNIESYGLENIGLRLFVPRYGLFQQNLLKIPKKFILHKKVLFIKEIEEFTDCE